jgi:large subunit ribosomal protein L22
MTGPKTNERAGTRATLRGYHMSASKARVVLNLIRNEDVTTAREILTGTTREAADVIAKVLASAVANAVNNDGLSADELYVSAAYADEGITMKRFTPRARGRAGRIRKRACHITVVVSRLDDERLEVLRAARSAQATASRARRVATSRRREAAPSRRGRSGAPADELGTDEVETDEVEVDEVEVDEVELDDVAGDDVDADEVESEVTDEATEDEASVEETDDGASNDAPEETGK